MEIIHEWLVIGSRCILCSTMRLLNPAQIIQAIIRTVYDVNPTLGNKINVQFKCQKRHCINDVLNTKLQFGQKA